MYVRHNENPNNTDRGDCVIRAISLATGQTWDDTYVDLAVLGFGFKDMPSSNYVWSAYLKSKDSNMDGGSYYGGSRGNSMGYSRTGGDIMTRLETMMAEAPTEREREAIRRALEQM